MNTFKHILMFCVLNTLITSFSFTQVRIENNLFLIAASRIPETQELNTILTSCKRPEAQCLTEWILNQERFKLNVYAWMADDFLEGVSDGEIMASIMDAEQIVYSTQNTSFFDAAREDYEGWKILKYVKNDLLKGNLDYQDLLMRMLNNPRFDEINMGADNFVNKTFYLMLNRYPTEYERINGVKMVEGKDAILFLKRGRGREDFLNILLTNDSFVEYQLSYWHEKLTLKQLSESDRSLFLSSLNKKNCFSLDCMLELIIESNVLRN